MQQTLTFNYKLLLLFVFKITMNCIKGKDNLFDAYSRAFFDSIKLIARL